MTQKQIAFLDAMLQCSSISNAANRAGISPNTATKYMKDTTFRAELDRRRNECLDDTVRFLQANLAMCGEALIGIIENEETPPQTKINAINTVFTNFRAMYETLDIANRLAQLEKLIEKEDEQ